MCKWLLNGVTLDCAMTLTTGHHRALNILYPRGVSGNGSDCNLLTCRLTLAKTAPARSPFAANTTSAYMPRTSHRGGGISQLRRCVWCINCADGCASTLTLHYHKEGWSNFLGTGSSKMLATAVMDIWEV